MEHDELRILLIEDSEDDALLILRELEHKKLSFNCTRVDRRDQLDRLLDGEEWDVILSDYALPDFDALHVMHRVKERKLRVPVIVISGAIGEEKAVECMRYGAWDYLLKDRMARIVPAIQNAVEQSRLVDARREAERRGRESHDQYHGLFGAVVDPILIVFDDGTIADANPAACSVYGLPREAFIGTSVKGICDEPFPEALDAIKKQIVLSGSFSREAVHKRSKGERFPVEVHVSPFRYQGRSTLLFLIRDVTERKKWERAIRESEETYRSFFSEDLTGDFIASADGELLSCNPAYLRIFGFETHTEARRYGIPQLYHDPGEFSSHIQRLHKEKKLEYIEIAMKRRDDAPVHIVANIIGDFGSNGSIMQIQGYFFDDTSRRQLEQQLIQAQKLESLGILAGGIAHDFNNILAIIMGHISLMLDPQFGVTNDIEVLNKVMNAAKRGAGLVRQLLTFARKTNMKLECINLNDMVKELLHLLSETLSKTILITEDLQEPLPLIEADINQLQQVLLNLCVNARDAMPGGGLLRLRTREVEGSERRLKIIRPAASRYVALDVIDSGFGMAPDVRERIFEPFFTTKDEEQGTGLGLAIAFGIVENHGGSIHVESEPGQGTIFTLYFPVTTNARRKIPVKPHPLAAYKGGSETILLVEDEALIAEYVKTTLTMKGYRVVVASDGEAALRAFKEHSGAIPLVISDIGLPKMPGDVVVRSLLTTSPHMKAILASGYIEFHVHQEFAENPLVRFVQKPYAPQEILQTVRELLDGSV